jgi:hypothetical protein
MEKQNKIRVAIINKFGPTSNAITGKSARELGEKLNISNDFEVFYIFAQSSYKNKNKDFFKDSDNHFITIKSAFHGKNGLFRLLGSLVDGFKLWRRASSLKPDKLIVMTDPPLLPMWSSFFPSLKKKYILWSMDIYPQAFFSAGIIKPSNALYKFINYLTYRIVPIHLISLGLNQANFLYVLYKKSIPTSIIPCGIVEFTEKIPIPKWKAQNQDKIILCYAGNIGEAHDHKFITDLLNSLNVDKYLVVLALYGAKANKIKELIKFPGIHYLDSVSHSEMLYVDAQLATLLPSWTHVCVPSKVVTSISLGIPVILKADEESDIMRMFKNAIIDDYSNLSSIDFSTYSKSARQYSEELKNLSNIQFDLLKKILLKANS